MYIERNSYIEALLSRRGNGLVKVITGIRRSGKSFLLFELYRKKLKDLGVPDDRIITLALDDIASIRFRDPLALDSYIRSLLIDKTSTYYVFLDEIQKVETIANPYVKSPDATISFVDVVLGLMKLPNVDLYVTGSNSRMLSSDILTEFRGRGDEIRVRPLTYKEFYGAFPGEKRYAWREYCTYGGMPFLLSLSRHEDKSKYLKDLFTHTYLSDILEHNKIMRDRNILEDLMNIISSSVGSLTNPSKLANTFQSVQHVNVTANTISRYLDFFIDAFLLQKACRYDIKGRKYIGTPLKYYFSDVGLRNAQLSFRQQEENHIMENILYNELSSRGFDVDIGLIETFDRGPEGQKTRSQLEVDFVANKGSLRYYIQSAWSLPDEEKRRQEIRSLRRIDDSFQKIVAVKDDILPWRDEYGIQYINIEDLLLDCTASALQ